MANLQPGKYVYTKAKTRTMDLLREEILKLPINNLNELRLHRFFAFSSTYYSLVLSGVEEYIGDVEELLYGRDAVSIEPARVKAYQNYKKLVQYVSTFYNRNTLIVDEAFVRNMNKVLLEGVCVGGTYRTENYMTKTFSSVESDLIPMKLEEILAMLFSEDSIHPLVKSALFYIDFMCLHPFPDGNGRTARLLTQLYLYKSGYSCGGLFSLEKALAIKRGRKHDLLLSKSMGKSYEERGDEKYFIKFYLQSACISATKLLQYIRNPDLLDEDTEISLNERQKKLLSYIEDHESMTIADYLMDIHPSPSLGNRDFDRLRELGFIEKKGLGKSTFYIFRKRS